MAKPYTTAAFTVSDEIYYGCATFDRDADSPWHVFILRDGDYYCTVGDFAHVEEGWSAAKQLLGITSEVDLPRNNGEPTDGGPFGKEDGTHIR